MEDVSVIKKAAEMNAEHLLTHFDRIADTPDAIPRLRRFILDLAVRGKLVPQDPNDEPASELLKRIAAEKARLVKAGKIKKTKPQLPFFDDTPFKLPDGWAWSTVGEICSKTGSGSTPRGGKNTYREEGIVFLRSQNVYDDGLRLHDVAYIDAATHVKMSGTVVHPADLLLNITGGSIGRCCRVPDDFDEANISQHVALIRIAVHGLQDYVHRLILSPYFQAFIFGEQTGAGRGGLPKNKMDLIPLALPPLAEQHRIVAKVDELMTVCDRLEAARMEREATRDRIATATLARLNMPDPDPATFQNHATFALNNLTPLTTRPDQIKALRQTILNLAVRGKLVPQNPNDEPASELLKRIIAKNGATFVKGQKQRHLSGIGNDDEAPYNIPVKWEWSSIGQLASDMRYGTSKKCDYQIKGIPVLRIPNVSRGEVDLTDLKFGALTEKESKALLLRENDLLVIRSNGSLGIVGRAAIVPKAAQSMSFAGYLVRVQFSQCYIQARYVWLVMNSRHVRNLIEKPIRSTVGLKNVNLTELAALTIPFPPLTEQHRIVAKVDELMALCDRLEASLATGDETRRRLLEILLCEAIEPDENRYTLAC